MPRYVEGSLEPVEPRGGGYTRRTEIPSSARADRWIAISAMVQAIPPFVWAAPLTLLFGFILVALWYEHGQLPDFVGNVLLWGARCLLAGGVVGCVLALRWCYGFYHQIVMDRQTRKIAKAKVRKENALAEGQELKNKETSARVDLLGQLGMLARAGIAAGMNVKVDPKGGLEIAHYLSNVHTITGGAGAPGQAALALPLPDKPSVEAMVSVIARNSLTMALGTNIVSSNPIIVDLHGRNMIILGRTQMGKSSLVCGGLKQMLETHDVDRLRLAVLDEEDLNGKLFEDDPHILEFRGDGLLHRMHARNVMEVAECVNKLSKYMEWRYQKQAQYGPAWMDAQAHVLIYFEEFLRWCKKIKTVLAKKEYQAVLVSIITLATRGLKANIHVLVCAQVQYEDKDLKEAIAQLSGIRVSLAVHPRAALAAGFLDNTRLKKVYADGKPGQFVVEVSGDGEIGMAADFDARAEVARLAPPRQEQTWPEEEEDVTDLAALPAPKEDAAGGDEERITEKLLAAPAQAPTPRPDPVVELRPAPKKPDYTLLDAKRAWNEGATGPRAMVRALPGCTYYKADQFCKAIEEELRQAQDE